MTAYIIGMVFGSLAIAAGAGFLIYLSIKNRSHKKMIKMIGQSAEDQINQDIKTWAKQTNNIFIPASLYKYSTNKVFEVDSVLVTSKALIVIEIKSVKGGVEGAADQLKWTKVLGDQRFEITNPILQNDKHIEHIVSMTDIKVPTVSLIIYSNRVAYLKIASVPSHVAIVKHADLFSTLDKIDQALPVKLTDYEMKTVSAAIKSYRTNKKEDIELHKNITTKGRA